MRKQWLTLLKTPMHKVMAGDSTPQACPEAQLLAHKNTAAALAKAAAAAAGKKGPTMPWAGNSTRQA
jgi:hypothetical protein